MHHRFRITKSAAPVSVLLLSGVLVAGCGSSSSSSTETTAGISKAQFIAKGNAICIAGQKAQNVGFEAFAKTHGISENQEPSKAQMTELAETVFVPSVQHQISAVKGLGAPSGEEQQVEEALESAQKALEKVEANPELAFANSSPFHEAGLQLHAVGLTQCAKHT